MSVFRVDKSREFTVIANCVFKDRPLSAKAKQLHEGVKNMTTNKKSPAKRKNPYRGPLILIGVLLVIAILLAVFRGCEGNTNTDNPADTTAPGIVYDDGAVQGGCAGAVIHITVRSLMLALENERENIRKRQAQGIAQLKHAA